MLDNFQCDGFPGARLGTEDKKGLEKQVHDTAYYARNIDLFEHEREDAEKGKEKKTYCKPLESNTGEMKKGSELVYYYNNYKIMKVALLYRFGVLKFYLLKQIAACI